jgi:hypothetical protein
MALTSRVAPGRPAAPLAERSRATETAAPPVNLDQHRVRKQVHVGGLINEYCLVA